MNKHEFFVDFATGKINQSYSGKPFTISIDSKDGYVRLMTSLENGWPFLDNVIKRNGLEAMNIRYSENEISEFKLWKGGKLVRVVHAIKDEKWSWFEDGKIQDWENSEYYSSRAIKSRLTAKILDEYLNKCGYKEYVTQQSIKSHRVK